MLGKLINLFFRKKTSANFTTDKIDIASLLSASTPQEKNHSIITLDNYVAKLCNYGQNLDTLSEPQRTFFYIQELERNINNGGFNQYFFNNSGNFALETVTALIEVGAVKTSKILQQAIDAFPKKEVLQSKQEREAAVLNASEAVNNKWANLDKEFFKYEDDLNALNLNYIQKNKHLF